MEIIDILKDCSVIPIITIYDPRYAIPLAKALINGGLNVLEITLHNDNALDAIRTIRENVPDAIVGAGTLIHPQQIEIVIAAGAQFAVSPGLTPCLGREINQTELPFLPGVMTPSDIIQAQEMGFDMMRFFPAEIAGGIKTLAIFEKVFPDVQFYPTGGINRTNMTDYLKLKNVVAVGGTWLTPKNLLDAKDWESITELTKQTACYNN